MISTIALGYTLLFCSHTSKGYESYLLSSTDKQATKTILADVSILSIFS